MKADLIHILTDTFEAHAQQAESGVEFWLARDIQHLLGYAKWENFLNVVSKAKTACDISGHHVYDHFPDVRKIIGLGSGSQRLVEIFFSLMANRQDGNRRFVFDFKQGDVAG
jgi:DNA-damage-inducible protein D